MRVGGEASAIRNVRYTSDGSVVRPTNRTRNSMRCVRGGDHVWSIEETVGLL